VWEVVKFVTSHHKPLSIYRKLAAGKKDGPTELLKYVETRFASKILMIIRFYEVHSILEKLLVDDDYNTWVSKQKGDTKARGREIKATVHDDALLKNIKLCISIMEPCLRVLRLTDGTTGATLSNVYAKMLNLDVLYRNQIPGISERVRIKIHAIFMARWTYFHTPVMSAAYRLAPEYCRQVHEDDVENDMLLVFKKMATEAHPYAAIRSDYQAYEIALKTKSFDLTDSVAFSKYAQAMPPYQWANTYLRSWPHLRYVATRLLALNCSASGCEHSWSVEGWFHSKNQEA